MPATDPSARRIVARAGLLAAAGMMLCGVVARAEAPLSAIDWLSESVATPAALPAPDPPLPEEPPVSSGALPEDVSVSVIGAPSPDAAGILPPKVTGLPAALWGLSSTDPIVARLTATRTDLLPALQSLLLTLLLAESIPPSDSGPDGRLLVARIDKLLSMGALEQAAALLDLVAEPDATLFRRSFDVALLTGTEDEGCAYMQANPSLAPTLPARIFCLARAGDWNAAALTLETARALGQVTEEEDALLSRFLDAELAEGMPPLPPPARMTPLDWRLYEAIGETFPTTTLPVAFAHAELRDTAGWKAQIEAAERLARTGAIAPNRLLGFYTARDPAASGGVWDRASAVQRLEAALDAGDVDRVARILPLAWSAMASAELEVPFAELFADRLATQPLTGEAAAIAYRIGLLSGEYPLVAEAPHPEGETETFLAGLALGKPEGLPAPDSLGRAIAAAFGSATLTPETLQLAGEGRTGELILLAIDRITRGVETDLKGVTEGILILRRLGLEDSARRAGLQLMLLERRG